MLFGSSISAHDTEEKKESAQCAVMGMDNFIIVRTSMSLLWRPRLRQWTICDDFIIAASGWRRSLSRVMSNDLVAERLCWCSSRDRPIRAFGSIFLDTQNHLQRWNSVVDRDNTGSPHLARLTLPSNSSKSWESPIHPHLPRPWPASDPRRARPLAVPAPEHKEPSDWRDALKPIDLHGLNYGE